MFRRSKLSFLTTKDDRIKIFNDRINLTEKHLNEMCSGFALCTRKLAKYRDSYDELAKTVNHYIEDEELNASLTDGLKNFSNAVTVLADFMDLNIHRLELKIINELSQFEMLCKNTRENLRTAVIARDKEVLKQRQMLDLKAKFTGNNAAADSELLKAKVEVNRTNKEIDEIINKFEKRKLDDLKAILADFILLSMKYHTKSLEALSATYYDVTKIDEQDDYRVFQKLLKAKGSAGLEVPGTSKNKMAFRSQSMESLDRDKLLNPVIGLSKSKLSKSTRNLSDTNANNQKQDLSSEDDEEEDDSNENDDDDNADNFGEGSEDINTDDEEDDNTSDISSKTDTVEQFKSQFSPIKMQQSQHTKPEIKHTFKASSSNSLNQVLKPIEPLANSRRSNSGLVSKRLSGTTAGIQHSKIHQPYNEEDNANHAKTKLFKIGGSSGAISEATLVTVVESKHSNADNSGE